MEISNKEKIHSLEQDIIVLRFYQCNDKIANVYRELAELYDKEYSK